MLWSIAGAAWAFDPPGIESARSQAMRRYDAEDYSGFVVRMEAVAAKTRDETALYNLACGYALAGRPDQAIGVLKALVARGASFDPDDSDLDSLRARPEFADLVAGSAYYASVNERLEPVRDQAMAQHDAGRYDVFVQILESVASYSNNDRDLYNLACGYALTGRADEALAKLRILRDRGVDLGIATDSDFDAIRADPRFQELVAGHR
jgi:hypothetical protein